MKWRYVYLLIPLLFGVGIGLLYECFGGKQYTDLLKYFLKKDGTEKVEIRSDLFGNEKSGTYGGILAAIWDGGIWVWGRWGLVFFSTEKGLSDLVYTDMCNKRVVIYNEAEMQLGTTEVFQSVTEWRALIKVGSHIIVKYKQMPFMKIVDLYSFGKTVSADGGLFTVCR